MDNNNSQRRRPLHDPSRVRARDCKLWTAEEAAATLANVMRVRCKCRTCRGQTWVSRRTSAKHMKSIGRHPRLRANVEVRFRLMKISHFVSVVCMSLKSNTVDVGATMTQTSSLIKLSECFPILRNTFDVADQSSDLICLPHSGWF